MEAKKMEIKEIEMEQPETGNHTSIKNRRTHKVGTITLGLMLLFFGCIFLAHIFVPTLTYNTIWHLWPCVMISLGVEVLVSTFWTEPAKYDGWGIFLVLVITLFSLAMAGMEWIFDCWNRYMM